MDILYIKEDKLLKFNITEEIDHHTTEKMRRRMDYEIQRHMPRKVIFDFNRVIFMDSAGIGMIIGRYKLTSMLGGTLEICNIKPNIKKVLQQTFIDWNDKPFESDEFNSLKAELEKKIAGASVK